MAAAHMFVQRRSCTYWHRYIMTLAGCRVWGCISSQRISYNYATA